MDLAGKKIHFMGAGGIGMSALAGIAIDNGAVVSGCDRSENEQTEMLRSLGAEISVGHSPEHSESCDVLVYTSAVANDHPELVAAQGKAVRRGTFLAQMMENYRTAGIAGTHGKTSTTWLTAHILIQLNIDPTVLLGGVTKEMNGNYRCGSDIFVSELDESDGSFLEPDLDVAVITNIESEHLAYYGTSEKVVDAFRQYAEKNSRGLLILGVDNNYCSGIYHKHAGRKKAFGLNNLEEGLNARNIRVIDGKQVADIFYDGKYSGELVLPLSGRHNVLNSLAALLVAEEYGVGIEDGIAALAGVETVGRRMELIQTISGSKVYSDYAHHPTEVKAALQGARELDSNGKILALFQPHLYSRTRDYAAEFAKELAEADRVVVAEIYPAREEPIDGVDAELIRKEVIKIGGNVDKTKVDVDDINNVVMKYASEYSTILCIGAGDIDAEVRKLSGE